MSERGRRAFGYVRVSTREQHVDRQLTPLRMLGIPLKHIFIDKVSGNDFVRPRYQALLRRLCKNDIVYIKSIDRLGRNYKEIMEEWRCITKNKQADIVVLDMPLLDTRRGKDLLGTFLSDIVLQVLSFVAENERRAIRVRQAEGIREAKKRGVKFGRPKKPLTENVIKACEQYHAGGSTLQACAKACNLPLSSFYMKLKEWEQEKGWFRGRG